MIRSLSRFRAAASLMERKDTCCFSLSLWFTLCQAWKWSEEGGQQRAHGGMGAWRWGTGLEKSEIVTKLCIYLSVYVSWCSMEDNCGDRKMKTWTTVEELKSYVQIWDSKYSVYCSKSSKKPVVVDFQVKTIAAANCVHHCVQQASVLLFRKTVFICFLAPYLNQRLPSAPLPSLLHFSQSRFLLSSRRKNKKYGADWGGGVARALGRKKGNRDDSSLWFNLNWNAREPKSSLSGDRGQGGARPQTQHKHGEAEKVTHRYAKTYACAHPHTQSKQWKKS